MLHKAVINAIRWALHKPTDDAVSTVRTHGRTDARNARTHGRTYEGTGGQTHGRKDARTHGWT